MRAVFATKQAKSYVHAEIFLTLFFTLFKIRTRIKRISSLEISCINTRQDPEEYLIAIVELNFKAMKVLRQCCGIDVSMDALDVVLMTLQEDFELKIVSSGQFANTKKDIKKLMNWVKRHQLNDLPLQVVMEATGVYHEQLAYALYDNGFELAVVLPNKVANYCRSTDVRRIDDKISAKHIAEFGLLKKIDNWTKPDASLLKLKGLSREREQLLNERTRAKNQHHAKEHMAEVDKFTLKRAKQHIKFLDKLIDQVETQMKDIVDQTPWLKKKIEYICSLKGVGFITATIVIAETNGFNLIRNSRQLVCYAGYDINNKQSGTSVNTKARISHKGNKHIRKALYFPALTAVQHDEPLSNFYNRLFDRQKIKMKSYVAVQRKLLILIYTLWKKEERYNPEYYKDKFLLEQPLEAALTELDQVRS